MKFVSLTAFSCRKHIVAIAKILLITCMHDYSITSADTVAGHFELSN